MAIVAEAEAGAAERDALIAACDAVRAAKKLKRLGPRPTIGYVLGFDHTKTVRNKAGVIVKQVVPLPEEEHEHRKLELHRWELSERVWKELQLTAHEARFATKAHKSGQRAR